MSTHVACPEIPSGQRTSLSDALSDFFYSVRCTSVVKLQMVPAMPVNHCQVQYISKSADGPESRCGTLDRLQARSREGLDDLQMHPQQHYHHHHLHYHHAAMCPADVPGQSSPARQMQPVRSPSGRFAARTLTAGMDAAAVALPSDMKYPPGRAMAVGIGTAPAVRDDTRSRHPSSQVTTHVAACHQHGPAVSAQRSAFQVPPLATMAHPASVGGSNREMSDMGSGLIVRPNSALAYSGPSERSSRRGGMKTPTTGYGSRHIKELSVDDTSEYRV
jgi:hypothetical protein